MKISFVIQKIKTYLMKYIDICVRIQTYIVYIRIQINIVQVKLILYLFYIL